LRPKTPISPAAFGWLASFRALQYKIWNKSKTFTHVLVWFSSPVKEFFTDGAAEPRVGLS